jgi:hypothetical protein
MIPILFMLFIFIAHFFSFFNLELERNVANRLPCLIDYITLLVSWIREFYRKFTSIKQIVLHNFYDFYNYGLAFKEIRCKKDAGVAFGSLKGYEVFVGNKLIASQSEFKQIESLRAQLFHVRGDFMDL